MLPKRRRLKAAEVTEVLSKGRSVASGAISMKFIVKKDIFRNSAVVPKSVARQATERNRVRRALYRAIFSASLPQSGFWAVFFVRKIPANPLAPAFLLDIRDIVKKAL